MKELNNSAVGIIVTSLPSCMSSTTCLSVLFNFLVDVDSASPGGQGSSRPAWRGTVGDGVAMLPRPHAMLTECVIIEPGSVVCQIPEHATCASSITLQWTDALGSPASGTA